MKKFKKVTALLLTAVMFFAMGTTAFAVGTEGTPATPIEESKQASMEGHTFAAYQIFSGEWGEDGSLTKINWGSGIDAEGFLTALKADPTVGSKFSSIQGTGTTDPQTGANKSADAVARIASNFANDTDLARAFAKVADLHRTGNGVPAGSKLDAGYYLIVDTTDFNADGFEGDQARNLAFLQMRNGDTFNPTSKTGVPTLKKEVNETNDSVDVTVQDKWGKVSDYDIGDHVPFRLTGTLPANYDSYTTYKYVFHDTLSEALTFDDNVKVTVKNGDAKTELGSGQYAVDTASTGGESFTVTIADLKKLTGVTINADTEIIVEYTATLVEEGIVYGGSGNENKAYLEFSNDPNSSADGDETGDTPEDKVIVLTYKVIANKVDEAGAVLTGAKFQLFKYDAEEADYAAVGDEIDGAALATFEFKGVDAGKYKLVETEAPKGYNRAEDMYFEIVATYDATGLKVTDLKIEGVYDADGNKIVDADGTTATFNFTGVAADGTLTTDIMNLKGIILPSTGGIGTTIFYVAGAILVIGAGVLLVTKKRMGKTE